MKVRECILCHQQKPLRDFYKTKYTSDGYSIRCIPCQRNVLKRAEDTPDVDFFAMKIIRLLIDFIPVDISDQGFEHLQVSIGNVLKEYSDRRMKNDKKGSSKV